MVKLQLSSAEPNEFSNFSILFLSSNHRFRCRSECSFDVILLFLISFKSLTRLSQHYWLSGINWIHRSRFHWMPSTTHSLSQVNCWSSLMALVWVRCCFISRRCHVLLSPVGHLKFGSRAISREWKLPHCRIYRFIAIHRWTVRLAQGWFIAECPAVVIRFEILSGFNIRRIKCFQADLFARANAHRKSIMDH